MGEIIVIFVILGLFGLLWLAWWRSPVVPRSTRRREPDMLVGSNHYVGAGSLLTDFPDASASQGAEADRRAAGDTSGGNP